MNPPDQLIRDIYSIVGEHADIIAGIVVADPCRQPRSQTLGKRRVEFRHVLAGTIVTVPNPLEAEAVAPGPSLLLVQIDRVAGEIQKIVLMPAGFGIVFPFAVGGV